jgi:simple sugar transport system ATP-binding protein
MRNGSHIATLERAGTSIPELAKLMVGRDVFLGGYPSPAVTGDLVLKVENLWAPGEKELSKLKGISFDVSGGEILGIAGVSGNGQSELAEAIAGLRPVQRGSVLLNGKPIGSLSPKSRRELGLSHIPEDRNTMGLNRATDVKDNMICSAFRDAPFSVSGILKWDVVRKFTRDVMEEFDVRPADPDVPAQSLSGGNAQKVVVSREMSRRAPFLLASQPTRGVDIGSIETIRRELNKAKENGAAILLISSDLEEIMALSDRIAVMYEGRITGVLRREEANEENVGLLMTGQTAEAAANV